MLPAIREELMTVAIFGLILLVAAGVLTTAVVTSNTGAVNTDLWGATISNVSLGVVFVAGMLTTLVAVAGLVLVTAGLRRNRRLRQERRVLRRENQRLSQRVETTDTVVEEDVTDRPEAPADTDHREPFYARRSTAPVESEPARSTAPVESEAPRTDRAGERVRASETGSA